MIKKLFLLLTLLILVILLSACGGKYSKDFSAIINFTFDMTMDDVIAYEEEQGNTHYKYNEENNRLDFVHAEYESYYKHMYFFNEETDTLEQITYRDGEGIITDDDECEHIDLITNDLIGEFNKWDKEKKGGLFKYMYGQINGVKCQIKYQYSENGQNFLFISIPD